MRFFTAVLAVFAIAMDSTPALACAPYSFEDATGQGRVRGPDGRWRFLQLETHGQWLRYEYAHPRAPWGRLVVVGEIVDGKAWLFPLKIGGGTLPSDARVTWSTSLADALAEIHVPVTAVSGLEFFFARSPDAVHDAVNGIACTYARTSLDEPVDPTVCLHDSGMPVILKNERGVRVFELQRITLGQVSAGRFRRPPGFPVTAKRPKYLRGFTCGGGTPAPPP